MKKILLATAAIALGTIAGYSQGLVSVNSSTTSVVTTNGATAGKATGTGNYFFELLYSSNTSISPSANNVSIPSNLALWTDSGVEGGIGTGLSAGRITGGTSVSAAGWTLPGATYDNARSIVLVGWSEKSK